MRKPILLFALIVFLIASACAIPVETRWSAPSTGTTSSDNPGKAKGSAPVAQKPGEVVSASDSPTVTPTTEDLGTVPVESTPDAVQRAMPAGVVNIMVLGSDWRPNSGHRTDVIMLVSVNTVKQTVSVVSFPRDLYVPIPGWTTQRINTAEPHGGFEMLADTMDKNFGVRPEYYVLTDFQGFKGIIDSLGGVDVYAGSKLVDSCDLPQAKNGKCTILPGSHNMDGATALWYIRSRHTSSDLDRLRREQEVMTGIFVKMMSAGAVQNLPGLYARYKSSVQTNLTVQAITPLLPTAAKVFGDRQLIHRYALTVKEAKPYVTNTGAQVLLPDYDRINQILNEAIFNQ